LIGHVQTCAECRELHTASQRLAQGVRLLVPPVPRAGLAERIVARCLTEHRRARRLRQAFVATALAASLLLTCWLAYSRFGLVSSPDRTTAMVRHEDTSLPEPAPSLQRSALEAGEAVATLTRRTTNETVGQTRLLLPAVLPEPLLADTSPVQKALQPPAQSLREAQRVMSEGLEPVTTSARRAISLFLREVPPSGSS
jgi:hypothetical protein